MSLSREGCARVRAWLPEVALGIADGEQRARTLEHVVHCPHCRSELERLSALCDDLIALAPQHEPPAGFETRVLARLAFNRTRHRSRPRRLRRLAFAVALPAVAAATALALTLFYRSDLRLASQYRMALRNAHGTYFQSAALSTPADRTAGVVFAYQGSPSWLFYTLKRRYWDGVYREQIRTRTGTTLTLTPIKLVNGSWGVTTPVPVRDIASVKLVHQPDGVALKATLPAVER